ncbi:MAG: HD domain-containing protein, partial [Planctomycetota bacterium]
LQIPEILEAKDRKIDWRKILDRQSAYELMCEYTQNEGLRRHMLCVEVAMRAYAESFNEDVDKWGIVGLLHDFDYEKWPEPPDHPLQGSKILKEKGYPEDVIYAIVSHVDQVDGFPRNSLLDKTLFACDELCGFITAVALVRPDGMDGMKSKSVRKKMKQKSFAEKVSRDDIVNGAESLGIELNEHIQFVIDALAKNAEQLQIN